MKIRLPKIPAHALKIIILCVFGVVAVFAVIDMFTGTYFGHASIATKVIVFTGLLSISLSLIDPKSWITIEEEEEEEADYVPIRNARVTKNVKEAYELLDQMGWPIKKFRFVLVRKKNSDDSESRIGVDVAPDKRVISIWWTGDEPIVKVIAFTLVTVTAYHPLCEGLDANPLIQELHETLND